MREFWRVYAIVNGLAIVACIPVFIWAGFNVHNWMPYMLIAQIPPIVMMGVRRAFKGSTFVPFTTPSNSPNV